MLWLLPGSRFYENKRANIVICNLTSVETDPSIKPKQVSPTCEYTPTIGHLNVLKCLKGNFAVSTVIDFHSWVLKGIYAGNGLDLPGNGDLKLSYQPLQDPTIPCMVVTFDNPKDNKNIVDSSIQVNLTLNSYWKDKLLATSLEQISSDISAVSDVKLDENKLPICFNSLRSRPLSLIYCLRYCLENNIVKSVDMYESLLDCFSDRESLMAATIISIRYLPSGDILDHVLAKLEKDIDAANGFPDKDLASLYILLNSCPADVVLKYKIKMTKLISKRSRSDEDLTYILHGIYQPNSREESRREVSRVGDTIFP
jgi:hypothetical protein